MISTALHFHKMTHIFLVLSFWRSSSKWLFKLLLILTRLLTLFIILLILLLKLLFLKSKHLWRLIILSSLLLLLRLMICNCLSFVIFLCLSSIVILWSLLERRSFLKLTCIICVTKFFCHCVIHIVPNPNPLWPLRSMSWVSQWFSFFYSLIHIS
jgi:hypothetical protein